MKFEIGPKVLDLIELIGLIFAAYLTVVDSRVYYYYYSYYGYYAYYGYYGYGNYYYYYSNGTG